MANRSKHDFARVRSLVRPTFRQSESIMMTGPNQPSFEQWSRGSKERKEGAQQVNWLMHIQLQIMVAPLVHNSLLMATEGVMGDAT